MGLYAFNELLIDLQRAKKDEVINNQSCRCFTKFNKAFGSLSQRMREDLWSKINPSFIADIKWKELEVLLLFMRRLIKF